ncbi:MAG TPA: hypothetical protein VJJ98_00500 [Sedimentisphaerales bacterium]|nr:hypothetical protein [Sedimentisphaerales bacterium]
MLTSDMVNGSIGNAACGEASVASRAASCGRREIGCAQALEADTCATSQIEYRWDRQEQKKCGMPFLV